MTSTTPLVLAAATAAALVLGAMAAPAVAGPTIDIFMPNLHFVEDTEVATRNAQSPLQNCTTLEKSARIDPAECGTYSRDELVKMKLSQDD